jgi:hypothetical protein
MKQFSFLLLCLFFPLSTIAAESNGQADRQSNQQSQQEQKQSLSQQPVSTTRSAVGKQFQPTERIKADTVIAFPADI